MSAREEPLFMSAHAAAAVNLGKRNSLNNKNITQKHNGLMRSLMFPAKRCL